ncbi:hypothetical protein L484_017611 [Morus notabilis]|uniref:Uncharacterized protein n=1 Tax=Morus notabilis TaxID=981085 RepID=W9SWR8_9ROSA|nr:hypothetical protein L484_017611 [Morus notabilis]
MHLCVPSARPPPPLISCHASPAAVRTATSSRSLTSPPLPSVSLNPNSTPPSPLTCALHCPHFQSCSGCTHEFDLHRPAILDEASEFFQNLGVSDFTFDSCKLWGWRCRAKLAVRGSSENPLIGLYQEGTHNAVDIPNCKAHHPNINAAVELLKQGFKELSIEPYDEDEGTGDLRYVQMAVTTYDTSIPASKRYMNGKVQVSLVWNSRNENSPNSDKLLALANIIFGNRWRHLLGERDFWEHVGGIDISLAPSSFGQANTRAFDALLQKLQKSVRCVEINKESKLSFVKTVDRLPSSIDSSISWHHADTSKEPLSWVRGSDVVVVDPPRKGLDPSLLEALCNISSIKHKAESSFESPSSKVKDEKRPWILRAREASVQIGNKTTSEDSESLPQTLIYISCGWETFKEVVDKPLLRQVYIRRSKGLGRGRA